MMIFHVNILHRHSNKTTTCRLYEVKDERHAEAFWNHESLAKVDALPLGERVAALQDRQASGTPNDVKFGPGGSREISFVSGSLTKKHKAEGPQERNKRGIRSLGLKPSKAEFYAMGQHSGRGKGGDGKSRGRGRR